MSRSMLLFLVLLLLPFTGASADDARVPEIPFIQVLGEGSVSISPDLAVLDVGVLSQAVTAAAALRENSQAMGRLTGLLKAQGIAARDVQTRGFEVQPVYERPEHGAPHVAGYRVSNRVQVRVRDLERLGALLDAVVAEGANQVGGIVFQVAEPAPLLERARREAVSDARRQARVYAETAEVRLGRLLALEETGGPSPPLQALSMQRMEHAVPLAPGELTFRLQVRLRYEILQ